LHACIYILDSPTFLGQIIQWKAGKTQRILQASINRSAFSRVLSCQ